MLSDNDRRRLRDETVGHLVSLLKIDTSNPPGNETAACEYIRDALAVEGIESVILESAPGRGSIIARLKGDGSKKPFLMAGHIDVVPAQAQDWTADPFGGEIRDGCVWGRGALDMKHNVAIDLAAFLEIKRRGIKLKRDIIFCAAADEEQSGNFGMGWLVKNHFDKLECEYAINEGGGTSVSLGGKNVYMVQNSEKGANWYKVTTRGAPGHGSVPKDDNSIIKMLEAVREVSKPFPVRKTEVVEKMAEGLAKVLGFPKNIVVKQLFNPLLGDVVLAAIKAADPQLGLLISALMRDTVSVTMMNAGYKENVIPEKCEATLDCRILPGMTSDEFTKILRRKMKGVEVELMEMPAPNPTESPLNTELYDAISRVIMKNDPKGFVIPLLMPGATDNRFLREKGIVAYGFCPLHSETHSLRELMDNTHGIDERVPIDALEFGTIGTYDLLAEFCS